MRYTINLVEDEPNLNQLLVSYLAQQGWKVSSYFSGEAALEAREVPPHLWILDIMLPGIDGYQLLRQIKASAPSVPVIFISARDADIDRIVGLELGSDDYLAKPFLPRELVIRAKRLLERVYGRPAPVSESSMSLPPYRIDPSARVVAADNGTAVDLTAKEFDLLLALARNRGRSLTREQLLGQVWGEDYFGSDRVVDDLIRRLRRKLPALRVETVYGHGYRLVQS